MKRVVLFVVASAAAWSLSAARIATEVFVTNKVAIATNAVNQRAEQLSTLTTVNTFTDWVIRPVPDGNWSVVFDNSNGWGLTIGDATYYSSFHRYDNDATNLFVVSPSYDYMITRSSAGVAYTLSNQTDKIIAGTNLVAKKTELTPMYSEDPPFTKWTFSNVPAGVTDIQQPQIVGVDERYWSVGFKYIGLGNLIAYDSNDHDYYATNIVFRFNDEGLDLQWTATREHLKPIGYTLPGQLDKVLASTSNCSRVAMFMIDHNGYNFELRAFTNNNFTTPAFVYSTSGETAEGFSVRDGAILLVNNRLSYYNDDFSVVNKNEVFDISNVNSNDITRILAQASNQPFKSIVIVDASRCVRTSGAWLASDNDDIVWNYTLFGEGVDLDSRGCRHLCSPVKWMKKVPSWANNIPTQEQINRWTWEGYSN